MKNTKIIKVYSQAAAMPTNEEMASIMGWTRIEKNEMLSSAPEVQPLTSDEMDILMHEHQLQEEMEYFYSNQ